MKPRVSRLAVASMIAAVALPLIFLLISAVVGLMGGVPLVGVVLVLVAIPGLALALLFSSSLIFGMGSAAAARIRETPGLQGAGFAAFSRATSMLNAVAALVLLSAYIGLPSAVAWTESTAWRRVAMHSVDSINADTVRLASAADAIDHSVAGLKDLGTQAQAAVQSLTSEGDGLRNAIANLNASAAVVQGTTAPDLASLVKQAFAAHTPAAVSASSHEK